MGIDGVDLNVDANRSLFADIVSFKSEIHRNSMLFRNPDQSTQRVVQAIAHSLDLEYEFSLATRDARVTRPISFHPAYDAVAQLPQSFTSGQQAHTGDPSLSSNFWDDSLGIGESFPQINDGGGCPSLDLYSWLEDWVPTIDNVTGAFQVPDITGEVESIQPADGTQEQQSMSEFRAHGPTTPKTRNRQLVRIQ
ncbi:hypothetical protein NA56DRAFT_663674 [Hyaloscypha hepaticicola]|uniref:Uncharacterized protein n=1 Tax=Hyaloscypha hepaticicola TaxID=2082293 RepID=A0A2J6PP81_9HELO|nr:hypothetical protein NA56DRAFT_663674 [Hyaloscypha hepaticicola]